MKLTKFVLPLALTALATPAFASDCNANKATKKAQQTTYQAASFQSDAQIYQTGNYSKKKAKGTIIDAAVSTADLSTLVAAVQAAGLVDTLAGDGPFTVFAPTNAAFDKLPAGTVETLLKPENNGALTNILTSHVVAGNLSGADIVSAVQANGGKLTVETLSGAKLYVSQYGDTLKIKDETGAKSFVRTADVMTSNGVVHVIDGVLLPGEKKS